MKKEDISFLSSDKKNNIHAICCSPSNGQFSKILQIVHGMTEYIESIKDKHILFIHTGGTPLFFDELLIVTHLPDAVM